MLKSQPGDNMTVDHEFGGQHTDLKLRVVEEYLRFFATALSKHFENLVYIDAFAGTGKRTVRVEAKAGDLLEEAVQESVEQRRGSAQIAIDVEPHFSRLIFIEENPRYCAALAEIASAHPDRKIDVIQGDANAEMHRVLRSINWAGTRGVLFLDPYGMEVDWSTLAAAAATGAIDVWFLFSLSGLYRQATLNKRSIDDDKRRALNRILGAEHWEKELYSKPKGQDLFGENFEEMRTIGVRGLENFVKARLETIFPKVFEPLRLPSGPGPQRYSLFCAISNASPKAIGLATKAANHILKAGISSKNLPR